MRKNLFLSCIALVVLLSLVVTVEADSTSWGYTYGGVTDKSGGISVVAAPDGGYAVLGVKNFDCWLIKTDDFGNMVWNQIYGGTYGGRTITFAPCSLVTTSDGGYAIAGSAQFLGTGGYDFWLTKTDSYGNIEWNQTYGGKHRDSARSMVQTSDGGYAIAGSLTSEDVGQHDGWLVKTDAYGNMVWNKTYGKFEFENIDQIYSVIETSDGGFALTGYTQFRGFADGKWTEGNKNFWLIKTDSFGNIMWEKIYADILGDSFSEMIETSDGGYALLATTRSFGAGSADFWLIKTDALGNEEWNRTYGGPDNERASTLVATSDGGYALAGTTKLVPEHVGITRYSDVWLVKTDAYWNMEWNRTYGNSYYHDNPRSLIEASDGGYVIAGSIREWRNDGGCLFLMKTDETGYIPDFPDFIPEYHSLLLTSLLLAATLVIVIYKKRLLNQRS